jgi:hypothetical protein
VSSSSRVSERTKFIGNIFCADGNSTSFSFSLVKTQRSYLLNHGWDGKRKKYYVCIEILDLEDACWKKNGRFVFRLISTKVTRLGVFLNIRWLFMYIGQVYETYQSSTHFWATFFPRLRLCNNFDKKIGWATFWAIFQTLIWSPWFSTQFCEVKRGFVDRWKIVPLK